MVIALFSKNTLPLNNGLFNVPVTLTSPDDVPEIFRAKLLRKGFKMERLN